MSNSNSNPSKRALLAIQLAQNRNKRPIESISSNNDQNRNEAIIEENLIQLNEENHNDSHKSHDSNMLSRDKGDVDGSNSRSLFFRVLKDSTNLTLDNNDHNASSSEETISNESNSNNNNMDCGNALSDQSSSTSEPIITTTCSTVSVRQAVSNRQSSSIFIVPHIVAETQRAPPSRTPYTAVAVSTLRPAPVVQGHNDNLNATASSTTVPSKSSCSKIEGRVSSIALTRDVANLVLGFGSGLVRYNDLTAKGKLCFQDDGKGYLLHLFGQSGGLGFADTQVRIVEEERLGGCCLIFAGMLSIHTCVCY